MMQEREILPAYEAFLGISPQASIFCRPWWLDAVAPDSWDIVFVERDKEIAAAWPFVIGKSLGRASIEMPPLTQTLGILYRPYEGKYSTRLSREKELTEELLKQLPSFVSLHQLFHFNFTNWLPLYWAGFGQTTRYTYVLERLEDLDGIWKDFSESTRREVRKAQKTLDVDSDLDLDTFLDLNGRVFKRQKMKLPYRKSLMERLDRGCNEHGARKIFFAKDRDGNVHGALYLVWDENSAYYLMSGVDPESRTSGAGSLLIWEAIRFAATVTKRFDFEGSMLERVERHFRGFGAVQKPYFSVTKANSVLEILRYHSLQGAQSIFRRHFGKAKTS